MNQIGADARRGVQDGNDLNTGLQKLIADDYADIACTNHQYPIAGPDPVDVHQSLDCAGTVDARQIVVGEGQGFFKGAGGANNGFGFDFEIFPLVFQDGDHVVLVEAHSGGVQQDLYLIAVFFQFLQQNPRNVHAPM